MHRQLDIQTVILQSFRHVLQLFLGENICKVASYSRNLSIRTSIPVGNELLGRKAMQCSLRGLVRAPFLLSLLCLTGFAGQFEDLSADFCGKWLCGLINRKSLEVMVQWWSDTSSMALTMSLQVTMTKVPFQGSVGTQPWFKIVKQCFIVKEWIIHSLLCSLWIMFHSFTENHWLTYT